MMLKQQPESSCFFCPLFFNRTFWGDLFIQVLISFLAKRGRLWDFCFCGFGYFLDRVFGVCPKRLQFLVLMFIAVANFSFFSIWFSLFVKDISGFSFLVSDVVF